MNTCLIATGLEYFCIIEGLNSQTFVTFLVKTGLMALGLEYFLTIQGLACAVPRNVFNEPLL